VFPIITLTTLLQFCSPTATRTAISNGYEEDLSIYRDKYEESVQETSDDTSDNNNVYVAGEFAEPSNDIKAELDSVSLLIIESRKDIESIDGFTIQLYSGNDRNRANEVRRAAFELIKNVKPSMTYEQPNYKIRIGKYFSRLEANPDYNLLKSRFSRAVLIPAKIKIEDE
jgi:hypothetical protein